MNTPNKLTVLRILIVPVFMVFLLDGRIPGNMMWAALCFAAASVTDLIDGKLARKRNQVTTFGKFLDPIADKMLVAAALICFVQLGYADAVVAVVIIAREFLVTSLRLIAVDSGTVIAANYWGKTKTVSQIIAILAVMLFHSFGAMPVGFDLLGRVLLWVAAAFTVVSGVQYAWANRRHIDTYK